MPDVKMNITAGTHNRTTGSQACAACKYQRRKCIPNCPLAPFFPPHHHTDFMNAHKLFGVGNILKHIKNLNPENQILAMRSIIFEANARARDPVGGCLRILIGLERQIQHLNAERELVLHHLAVCRAQQAVPVATTHDQSIGFDGLSLYNDTHDHHLQTAEFHSQNEGESVVVDTAYHSSQDYNTHDSVLEPSTCLSEHGKASLAEVGDNIKPLLVFDERDGVGFDSKESVQCSDKEVLELGRRSWSNRA